jgi:hypothetical protein
MTVTLERPETAPDPNALIPAELHTRMAARIRADHPEHADRAIEILDQALAFLTACAARPAAHLAPSELVDIGWHTLILYTRDYAEFCQRIAGRFIHHQPTDDGQSEGGCTAADTVAVMRELGLPVIADLWAQSGDCSDKCSQCHQGCVDSN